MELIKKVKVTPITLTNTFEHKGQTILEYDISYPKFSSKLYSSTVIKMNDYYESEVADYKKYINTIMLKSAITAHELSIGNDYPVLKYEATLKYDITYNRSCIVSLYEDKYEYEGGAHGNTLRTSQTWDMNKGKEVLLNSFFRNGYNYIEEIKSNIKKQIAWQIKSGNNTYFENYNELVDKTFSTKNFYLTPKAFVFYFQQYDIAPYFSGIREFNIPYKQVNAKLPKCD